MNKKLLTTLLLCIFTIEPICWAEEVIVGANGQARYSNQKIQVVNKKDIRMDNQTNQNAKSINDNQSLNRNVEQVTSEKIQELAKPYQKKNLQLINKEKKKRHWDNFPKKTDWKQISDKTYKIPLLGGDYILWDTASSYIENVNVVNTQYATEYDKNNVCKGVIKIVQYDATTFAFYEYRIDINDIMNLKLTHIMLLYGDKHKAAFVYTVDGEIRSCSLDNKLYSVNLPIVPSVPTIDYSAIAKGTQAKNTQAKSNETSKDDATSTLKAIGGVIAAPFEDAMMLLAILALGIFLKGNNPP